MDVIVADPTEAIRRALKASWQATAELAPLGQVVVESAETSGQREGSYVVMTVPNASADGMTNRYKNWLSACTIKVHGVSQGNLRHPMALISTWLQQEERRLGSGNLTTEGVRVYGVMIGQAKFIQTGSNAWRGEIDFRVRFGIPRIG